ncbi:hypothetical protein ACJIZ3_020891 [Penstemon smallii]|uniref:BAT2 N-terminal domain-containing protein n=1 Tax=Penstemon smallii TaxID=265156 RepID=A0ABD3SK41_9LAMI
MECQGYILVGEWASARRGGMTVLGKVAVPKPLNLPSQRLENHGLDPGVEIVPKGTLSWGSRPSSSGSNAWVSSSLSPNADGGNTSPTHLSGLPSSGGSGTRPSTSGSDKTHEPVASSWGSRPSSASGALGSNQSLSASLRPRSAETRPSSSQLSRFAEPVSESSPVAWGPSSAAERLGVKSSKEDAFSLSSGDFPTLGSEKVNNVKNNESQDLGRPSSASGRITHAKESDTKSQADARHGSVNTWTPDVSRIAEDGIHPSMEKWQGEPQPYFNANVTPQHYDAWRGPPVNAPAGVWYRGHPRGPPFGTPVAPGGFPMEPFPYYRPQIPPQALAGPQPGPPPGTGPRGPHPKNGELYRPQIPDAYARPGVPFRPGFYPGPHGPPGPMAYESYYGPPMGFCNNERDLPYMGMAAGPPVYNGYPGPRASEIGTSHGSRAGGRGPKTVSEHMDADHWEDTLGPKRVPPRNYNEWDQKEEGENREHNIEFNNSNPGKSCIPMMPARKSEWGAEDDGEEDIFAKRRTLNKVSSHSSPYRDHSSDSVKVKSFEGMGNVKADDNWTNKSESGAIFPPQMPQLPFASEKDSSFRPVTKDSALMQKIDGLNAKVRSSDARNDASNAYNREEQKSRSELVDMKIKRSTCEGDSTGSSERTISGDFAPVPHEVIGPLGHKPTQPMAVMSRRLDRGGQGRVDHYSKGKFNNEDADGWRRKPLTPESSSSTTASNIETSSGIHSHGPGLVGKAAEIAIINPVGKFEGESVTETNESTDIKAQRAKMKELAKQRALQLQKEEEERIREQKAKALAKLEELNRRTKASEAESQRADGSMAISEINGEQGESCIVGEPVMNVPKFQAPTTNFLSEPDVTAVDRENTESQAGESVEVSRNLPLEISQTGLLEYRVKEDSHIANASEVAALLTDGGASRHKRTGYKQKHLLQKSLNEKSVPNSGSEAQKDLTHGAAIDITSVEVPSEEFKPSGESSLNNTYNRVAEPSTNQRKKVNRSNKNKQKLDVIPAVPALPPVLSNINPEKGSSENDESKAALSNSDSSVLKVVEPERGVQVQEAFASLANEQAQTKGNNHWKPQPSRRMPRTQQANRFVDRVHGSDNIIWAPVRNHNKAEGLVEASPSSILETANPAKIENVAHISSKGKRAEMERYVPKPVAKELAQQGGTPPLSSSLGTSEGPGTGQCGSVIPASPLSSASPQPISSTSVLVGSSVEIEGDGKHNKHKKEHGTWRQRGAADFSQTKGIHFGTLPLSEPTKDIQQSAEHNQSVRCEINSTNAEIKTSGQIDTNDGHNMPNDTPVAALSRSAAVKDQGPVARGKRHMPRGPRSTGNNPVHENILSGGTDGNSFQSAAPDVTQMDRTVASKENRSFGERTSSHWQPKSRSNSTNNQHGNRTSGSEIASTEVNKLSKKDHPQLKGQIPPQHGKESSNTDRPQSDPSLSDSNFAEESASGHQQEFNREKKPAPARGHPFPPNQVPVVSRESVPERNIASGSRRNSNQNSRSGRVHEARGDWSSGQDNRQHNVTAFRERQGNNVKHYEYQPVAPNKGSKPEKLEGSADEAIHVDPRFRERGHSHPKRGGNYYRRQSGAARVESGQD